MAGISIWQLLIILAIIVMLFGTKRLRSVGGDMGGFIRGFKDSIGSDGQSSAGKSADGAAKASRNDAV